MRMLMRKPIIQVKGGHNFKYRNCFKGYAAGIEIEFDTDLSRREFNRFLDGKYNGEQIRRFEMTGKF